MKLILARAHLCGLLALLTWSCYAHLHVRVVTGILCGIALTIWALCIVVFPSPVERAKQDDRWS